MDMHKRVSDFCCIFTCCDLVIEGDLEEMGISVKKLPSSYDSDIESFELRLRHMYMYADRIKYRI